MQFGVNDLARFVKRVQAATAGLRPDGPFTWVGVTPRQSHWSASRWEFKTIDRVSQTMRLVIVFRRLFVSRSKVI